MLCAYCQPTHGLVSRPQNESSCARPPSIVYATGCCIQAFVAMMKNPEIHEPAQTMNAESQYQRGAMRPRPARKTPMNTDSAKKANTPSIASVCPITPPAKFEKPAQFVPNWNSSGMPVTTPTPKLTAKIVPQKCAARSCALRSSSDFRSGLKRRCSPPNTDTVTSQTMNSDSPMVRI